NGRDFTPSSNLVRLPGPAPIEVTTLRVNGIERPVQWTTITNWVVNVVLAPQVNHLAVEALNEFGQVIPGGTGSINVTFTGTLESPQDKIVLNEIMTNPILPNGGYVEIFNNSASSSFDLSGWR